MRRHAEIAGAGFAGLTLAAALAQRGWSVRVHERAAELREGGAGIFLWANGLEALGTLGCLERVLMVSYAAPAWQERDGAGRLLAERPLPPPGGGRMVTLRRQDLHAALLETARSAGVEVLTRSRVVAAAPDGALVTADGARRPADLAVGADGISSPVRESLPLSAERRTFDFTVRRLLVPLQPPPDGGTQWRCYVNYWDFAARRRVLYVPCGGDALYLLLGAFPDDRDALREPLDAAVWAASFPALASLLADVPRSPHLDRYELVRVQRWSAGRAALVGDAAHAMPPTIGQGAGTAMTNAVSLATHVAEAADVARALRAWEEAERPRTEDAQRTAAQLAADVFPRPGERLDEWGAGALRAARSGARAVGKGLRGQETLDRPGASVYSRHLRPRCPPPA